MYLVQLKLTKKNSINCIFYVYLFNFTSEKKNRFKQNNINQNEIKEKKYVTAA